MERLMFVMANENDIESRWQRKSHTSSVVNRRKALQNEQTQTRKKRPRRLAPASALAPTPSLLPPGHALLNPSQLQSNSNVVPWTHQSRNQSNVRNWIPTFGAGRTDPFQTYPIQTISKEQLELVDHFLLVAPSQLSKPQKRFCFLPIFGEIRTACYVLSHYDAAAFHSILAVASADISILRDEAVPTQAIRHNTRSLQILRKRMLNLSLNTVDGIIASVALQIVFLILFADCDMITMHIHALQHLVDFRGGMKAIAAANHNLELLVNLADYMPTCGAMTGIRVFRPKETPSGNSTQPSPVAFEPPAGLEPLLLFDIYNDILNICQVMRKITKPVFSERLKTCFSIEIHLQNRCCYLIALGSSNIGWARRAEIMKSVVLIALIYIYELLQSAFELQRFEERINKLVTEAEEPWQGNLRGLAGAFMRDDNDQIYSHTASLMRNGCWMNQEWWQNASKTLHRSYKNISGLDMELQTVQLNLEQSEIDMRGLSALFSVFQEKPIQSLITYDS